MLRSLSKLKDVLAGVVAAVSKPPGPALAVGAAAPDFTLPGTDGLDTTLSSFQGQKNVVLAFFAEAFTPG